jgi:phosphoribosyl-dephospho-CoA transferase
LPPPVFFRLWGKAWDRKSHADFGRERPEFSQRHFPKTEECNLATNAVAARPLSPSSKMSFTPEHLRRHSFAWITDAESPSQFAEGETPQNDLVLLRNWLGTGRPVIIRRPCLSEDGESVYVGLSLPPDPVKRRLAFRVPFSSLANVAEPPLWTECADAFSESSARVNPILTVIEAAKLPLQSFGSYAWQYHTGLSYVTPRSDIDLIVPINRREDWRRFRRWMSETQKTDHRVDLEIILNGDVSFHWREFEAPGKRLLFKGNRSVWIGDKSDVEALLND